MLISKGHTELTFRETYFYGVKGAGIPRLNISFNHAGYWQPKGFLFPLIQFDKFTQHLTFNNLKCKKNICSFKRENINWLSTLHTLTSARLPQNVLQGNTDGFVLQVTQST